MRQFKCKVFICDLQSQVTMFSRANAPKNIAPVWVCPRFYTCKQPFRERGWFARLTDHTRNSIQYSITVPQKGHIPTPFSFLQVAWLHLEQNAQGICSGLLKWNITQIWLPTPSLPCDIIYIPTLLSSST